MKRFSLRALLILVTAMALFLGYSQWWRHSIRTLVKELGTIGVDIAYRPPPMVSAETGVLPNEFRDELWQRAPTTASIHVFELSPDRFRIGETLYSRPELIVRLLGIEKQLRGIGVTDVGVAADGKVPYSPSDWVKELRPQTTMKLYFCENGDSTYDFVQDDGP
jgi:hypothetical protein